MQGSLHSLTYTIHNRIILLLYCLMTSAFKFWIALPGSRITMETFAGVPLFAYPSWFNSFSAHNVGCCILHISYSLWLFIRFFAYKSFLAFKRRTRKNTGITNMIWSTHSILKPSCTCCCYCWCWVFHITILHINLCILYDCAIAHLVPRLLFNQFICILFIPIFTMSICKL